MDILSSLVPSPHTRHWRYAIVIALTTIAFFARQAMAPAEGGIQYVTFFPAVAISAVIGGFWAGMLSAAIGVIVASFFFWPPYATFDFTLRREMLVANSVFLIDAVLVSSVIEALHRCYKKFGAAEHELRLAASVFHNTAEGVMVMDDKHVIQAVNPAFTDITGYSEEEAVGREHSFLHSDRHPPGFHQLMWDTAKREGWWQGELWNRRKNGEIGLEWLTISSVVDDAGEPVRYVAVFHDVTELRRKDEQLRHLAFHDVLTGLPNRTLILDRLEHALERARRDGTRVAVTFIDLDHFKLINDSLGHATGDHVLREVAERIKAKLRSADTTARLGGDEFLLLMEDLRDGDDCERVARELVESIAQPVALRESTLQISASVGMAFFPDDGLDAQTLMKCADEAMYAAKAAGRNTYRFFHVPALPSAATCVDAATSELHETSPRLVNL